jgi:hypothetical protein
MVLYNLIFIFFQKIQDDYLKWQEESKLAIFNNNKKEKKNDKHPTLK